MSDSNDITLRNAGQAAIDKPIIVTTFPNQRAVKKRERELSLRDLQAVITDAMASDKSTLPWFKLASFGNVKTDKGCLRNNANVESVTGLEADYDAGQLTMRHAAARLKKAGIAALLYTTPSSTPEHPRWRVFTPFAREHDPERRDSFMERLNAIFDGTIDGASFTLSQAYYGGNVEGRDPIKTCLVDGDFIDRRKDLPSLPKGKRDTEEGQEHAPDESGSGELFRLARQIKDEGGTRRDFESAILDNRAAAAHVKRNGIRAITRAWERAPNNIIDEFEDLPPLPKQKSSLTFLTPSQCAVASKREYVWKGLLSRGDVGCIFGAPGAGKSLLAPYVGYMVAQGNRAFDKRTKQGGVFYVAAEDEHGMRGRIQALRGRFGEAPDFNLVGGVSDLLSKGSRDLKELLEAVKQRKPALVIIDTLAMAFPALEENSAESMGRVVAVSRALAQWGSAVLLIHHDTKEGTGTPRGHSVLNGALDMAIHVARAEFGGVRGSLTKNRNGSCDVDIAFEIGVEELGIDEDGDPITVAHASELKSMYAGDSLSEHERLALTVLKDAGRALTKGEWQDLCLAHDSFVIGRNTVESQKRRFRECFDNLSTHDHFSNDGVKITPKGFTNIIDEFEDLPPEDVGAHLWTFEKQGGGAAESGGAGSPVFDKTLVGRRRAAGYTPPIGGIRSAAPPMWRDLSWV